MAQALILPLHTEQQASLAIAGGKGASLSRLVRAGFPVPPGFLVTTAAYLAFVEANNLQPRILELARSASASDPTSLEDASQAIRQLFSQGAIPQPVATAICRAYSDLSHTHLDPDFKIDPPVAVRSSATAEDLPDMSFAGQQDTFLNIVGDEALLQAVVNCWSSLWTARAIGYRARNGVPPEDVALAVVVQEMVQSEASGVLFTANPLNGKRTEMVIDATLGLGEALVAGHVEPDHYVVDAASGRILSKTLGSKAVAIHGQAGGGTVAIEEDAGMRQALPDQAIVELARLGHRVAALLDGPQDIEWAWAGERLHLLQSRPITSLYPLPDGMAVEPLQALFSFGAVQGMLDPMTPLGQDTIRGLFAGAGGLFGYQLSPDTQRVILVAGERLFINVTGLFRHRIGRRLMRSFFGVIEPGTAQAIDVLWDDVRLAPTTGRMRLSTLRRIARVFVPIVGRYILCLARPDVERERFLRWGEGLVAEFKTRSTTATTLAAHIALLEDALDTTFRTLLPNFVPRMAAGMASLNLLNHLAASLSDGTHDALEMTRGLPHNVTTEMDLALWATASAIVVDPSSAARFEGADAATLAADYLAGRLPPAAQSAMADFLRRYGMRGIAEIDLGRPRWRENPTPIMQVLQSYLRIKDADQAPNVMFERGAASAEGAIDRLAEAMRRTRWGWLKARLVRWAARRMRALAGLRESPKFLAIRHMGIVRESLLDCGHELAATGVLAQPDDIFFLRLVELKALAAGETRDWQALVAERRQAYQREKLRRQVPRLLLSDGQAFYGGVSAPAETGAGTEPGRGDGFLVGSPVSPGVVEGIVHVVLDPHSTQLAPGEILVCPGTDPAWTPLFLVAGGLVMEVGGLMTHGAVVAREYGIPAVVGVHQAASRLKTGQRIRVDGSTGQIAILD